ncbi:MAG: dihydrofolate reductase family protein [Anaerolineales bacterium]
MKVTVNVAMTLDGKIDTVARKGTKISSPADWERVDRLRAAHDAILVGGNTLLVEDPRLTVKSESLRADRVARGLAPAPAKVGIVSQAALSANSQFLTDGGGEVFVFTTERTSAGQIALLRATGAQVFVLGKTRVDLPAAFDVLAARGIESLLVEGGGGMIAALLAAGLVDKIQVYIAPLIFGGATAPTLADGQGLLAGIKLELLDANTLEDGGILTKYQVLR